MQNLLKMGDMTKEEQDEYMEWDKNRLQSISSQIVEYFPEVMIWHTMILGMCVIRSPTDFVTACSYFALMMRIIMVFAFYCNKKIIYVGASSIEILTNHIMLFTAMGYSQFT